MAQKDHGAINVLAALAIPAPALSATSPGDIEAELLNRAVRAVSEPTE
jgi:hypothetical protein